MLKLVDVITVQSLIPHVATNRTRASAFGYIAWRTAVASHDVRESLNVGDCLSS